MVVARRKLACSHHETSRSVHVKKSTRLRELIQVCWNIGEAKTKEREVRSVIKAMNELSQDDALVITEEYEAEETVKGKRIRFLPLWKWLLGLRAL